MNPKLIALGGVVLAILALTTWGFWERSEKLSIKADYDGFIVKAQILTSERLAENKRKEVEYEERLKTAEFERTRLIGLLRQHEKRASESRLSITPKTTDNKLCFKRDKFDGAIQSFLADIEGLVGEGDLARIDRSALFESWPR